MIKSIQLHNFQGHADTIIYFVAGVNAIIGNTGAGKTAILRAFNWVINNRPSGDGPMSYWADEMFVCIELDNGIKITRGRDKKGNYYKHSRIENEFRAFKTEVPPEIAEALNISEINLQAQMDSPFLLSLNGGEVAQLLNKIVNLEVIDRAISNNRKDKLEVDRDLKYEQNRKTDLKQQLQKFAHLEDMEKDVLVLEQLISAKDKIVQQSRTLETLLEQIEQKQDQLPKYSALLSAEDSIRQIGALLDKKDEQDKKIRALKMILDNLEAKQLDSERVEKELAALEEKWHKEFPTVCPLCGMKTRK